MDQPTDEQLRTGYELLLEFELLKMAAKVENRELSDDALRDIAQRTGNEFRYLQAVRHVRTQLAHPRLTEPYPSLHRMRLDLDRARAATDRLQPGIRRPQRPAPPAPLARSARPAAAAHVTTDVSSHGSASDAARRRHVRRLVVAGAWLVALVVLATEKRTELLLDGVLAGQSTGEKWLLIAGVVGVSLVVLGFGFRSVAWILGDRNRGR